MADRGAVHVIGPRSLLGRAVPDESTRRTQGPQAALVTAPQEVSATTECVRADRIGVSPVALVATLGDHERVRDRGPTPLDDRLGVLDPGDRERVNVRSVPPQGAVKSRVAHVQYFGMPKALPASSREGFGWNWVRRCRRRSGERGPGGR